MLNMPKRVELQLRKTFDSLTKSHPQYYQREYRLMGDVHRWLLYRQGVLVADVRAKWTKGGRLTSFEIIPGPGMKGEQA